MAMVVGTGTAASSAALRARASLGKRSWSLFGRVSSARDYRIPAPSRRSCRRLGGAPPPLMAPRGVVPYGSWIGSGQFEWGSADAGGDVNDVTSNSFKREQQQQQEGGEEEEEEEAKVAGSRRGSDRSSNRRHVMPAVGCSSGGDARRELNACDHIVPPAIGAAAGTLAVLAALGRGAAATLSSSVGTAAITAGALGGAVVGELVLGRAGEEDVETDADVERGMEEAAERVVQKLRAAKATGGLHRAHQEGHRISSRS
ncbi:hypothetical protein Vafri_6495 [Volvox africanus]|uniref:Uncharacterized protein n=1 Tax=Volvox africanus TaxID=51714 RepID=A0A8J4EWU0_9CHLO|nr:hypothetical protein Vafri_6495 [Volvox africanus]